MNEYVPVDWENRGGSIIKVIGVGGGGCNAVKNMYSMGIEGVDFIVCNTDQQVLLKSPIPTKIQLGATLTKGRGAGCDPEQGRKAALESIEPIREVLANNTEMVFIAAGMGGGTGTGAAPVIAKEARELGILTVAIVTLPFQDEGNDPFDRAVAGIRELQQYVDSLLIINNQKLYEIYPNLSVFDAFPKADDIVSTAVKGIAEIITVEGYINVDFADVKMVMKNSGVAVMGTGKVSGEKRALQAAELALNSPLLSDSDIAGARNILVNISSGKNNPLKMSELGEVMNYINKESGGKANFKRGVVLDSRLDENSEEGIITVTIVATGFTMNTIPELSAHTPYDTVQVPLEDKYHKNKTITEGEEIFEIQDKPVSKDDETVLPDKDTFIIREANTTTVEEPGTPLQTRIQYSKPTLQHHKNKDITYLEETPAYERKNMNLNLKGGLSGSNNEISRHKLEGDNEDGYKLSQNNSFLDQIAD
ncbi:MAG: cell division protein FtsZ [Prevotellaceae bacterium]|jgi:cell division protein FtsZ|nr:cell division protein FtsZ [Prevotellaceae bacterium]